MAKGNFILKKAGHFPENLIFTKVRFLISQRRKLFVVMAVKTGITERS
jgi:hypothetical protein